MYHEREVNHMLVKLYDEKLEQFKKEFSINCYSVIIIAKTRIATVFLDGIPAFKIKKTDIIDYLNN